VEGDGVTRIRVAIVDDEPLARVGLRAVIEKDPEVVVVGECMGTEAAAMIERERVDILFLDVQMPEVDGFDVLAALRPDKAPITVFVTAHNEYAVRAFDVHAIDYVLKPIEDTRLLTALARAKSRLSHRSRYTDRFLVRERGKIVVVRAGDIDWIESADDYVTLHAGGETHLVRQTMSDLEASLDGGRFVRVHRGTIVNIDRVREVVSLMHGDSTLVLVDGTRVRLSRTRRSEFEKRFAAGSPRPRSG
jgi:two-component system LytT family response regulator